jgi:hypothetical protein
MADTYSKLLGLSDTHTPPSESGKAKLAQKPLSQERKVPLQANQQTSKEVKKKIPQVTLTQTNENTRSPVSTTPRIDKNLDTSLLKTKAKTKYGTYLTDESIEKIRICAIQTKRDDHQVVQEAINQYFEKLQK